MQKRFQKHFFNENVYRYCKILRKFYVHEKMSQMSMTNYNSIGKIQRERDEGINKQTDRNRDGQEYMTIELYCERRIFTLHLI